jgi:hypothetical protein
MTTEYFPIPGDSRAVVDWRRYAMRVCIDNIAGGGKWSTQSAVREFTIDVSQYRITTPAIPPRRVW